MAEARVERLHLMRARREGTAISDCPEASALKGLVMSTMTLAGQRIPVLGDDRHGAGVQHGEDDDGFP
jgi:hypothetical protein